ncbi:hypothetical protein DFS33DRAFT_1428608, partial [Desarmillaria ectypa]
MFVLFLALFLVLPLALASNPKRGLAFDPVGHSEDIYKASGGSCSWVYNWSPSSPSPSVSGIEFVPMQWGTDGLNGFLSRARSDSAMYVLVGYIGFNEPDYGQQSNIPVGTAVQMWKADINPLASSGIRLGSPAVTSADSGLQWLSDFLAQCSGCTVNFLAVHWYAYGEGAANFILYLQKVHSRFPNYKIWVTEFADTRTDSKAVLEFMKQVVAFMDATDWVERYAWF